MKKRGLLSMMNAVRGKVKHNNNKALFMIYGQLVKDKRQVSNKLLNTFLLQ